MISNKKGISLIVLVITIIVIIILAVAIILTIANNNPIENARKARFLNDLSAIQDEVTLEIAKQVVDSQGNYKVEDFGKNEFKNLSTVKGTKYENSLTVVNGKIAIVSDSTDLNYKEKEWAIEEGYQSTSGGGSSEEYSADVPTIPTGFTHTEGTVETGYVIKNDTDNNEFVWIPVPDMDEFVRTDWYSNNIKQTLNTTYYTEPYSYNGATPNADEQNEYNAMISSVKKYKGFYIARYEASQGEDGKAKSIAGKIPWVNIGWSNVDDMLTQTGGCVEKAREVYPVANATTNGAPVSTLAYGVQWDTAVNFMTDRDEDKKKDSTNFGNYVGTTFEYINVSGTEQTKTENMSIKVPTGSDTEGRNQLKNIYDMAGNVKEWTMEACGTNYRIYRGGNYRSRGTNSPLSHRYDDRPNSRFCVSDPEPTYDGVGFRLALYIAE